MKLKHVGIIVVSVLAMSSAAVSAAEGDESVTTTVNGGVIHFKGEVVNWSGMKNHIISKRSINNSS
ncbi:TPA: pilus assembly protein [Escherichia coli]|nr:pilus assembly protein [Escherichia coli]